jgi:hypothetical protein
MDLARARLHRQFLVTTPHRAASSLVRALGAVQAQDYAGAKWALAQRMLGAPTDADIEREVDAGRIIRTHILRPTWHFVAPEDIRWMLALTAPQVRRHMASYTPRLGLTPDVLLKTNKAIAKALERKACLTRQELKHELAGSRVGDLSVTRLAHIMMEAELEGIVCSGPMRGKAFTYALFDERVPSAPARDRDDALLAITTVYFSTRGPATAQDFSWWSGLKMPDARRGIEIAAKSLERVTIDDRAHWQTPGRPRIPRTATLHLLPNYDEFFIGYRDRSAIGERLGSHALVMGRDFFVAHVVVVDGQLVGGWRRRPARKGVGVTMDLLCTLTVAEQKRLDAQIQRFAAFLQLPVELQVKNHR